MTFSDESNVDPAETSKSVQDVFAELYEQYMPKVYRYIYFRIRDENMAQDLTATVFQKALTKFSGFKPQKASFSTWIFTITRNTVIDYYRNNGRVKFPESRILANIPAQSSSPEEEAIKTEYTEKLRFFLSRLKKRE